MLRGTLLMLWILSGLTARAQFPSIQLNTLSPPGGKTGETIELTITGSQLDDVDRLVFNHPGITAEAVTKDLEFLNRKAVDPGKFKVSIKGDVPPGLYEARAAGNLGISNPRRFAVDSIPVFKGESGRSIDKAVALPPDQVWYGKVEADQFDYFVFDAKQGQSFAVECFAERLDSRMDAAIQICDAQGHPIKRVNDEIGRDPLIYFTAPADGKYLVRVHDFIFRGGADYYYRLVISLRPHLRYLWPPAGIAGQKGAFTLYGLNLPGTEKPVEITLPATVGTSRGGRTAGLSAPGTRVQVPGVGPVWVGLSTVPVIMEKPDSNDAIEQAQELSWPVEAAGRFEKNFDLDWYAFDMKAKDAIRLEIFAERLGCPGDPLIRFYRVNKAEDGALKLDRISESDDDGLKTGGALYGVGSRDSALTWTADKDGRYAVQVVNQFSGGAMHHVYRLSVRKPLPDFQLMASSVPAGQDANKPNPYSPVLHKGGSERISVHALRRDGFNGAIKLHAEGLPGGFEAHEAFIAAGSDRVDFIVSGKADAQPWAGTFRIVGESDIDGKAIRREAQFATLRWPIGNLKEEYWQSRLAGAPALGLINLDAPVMLTPAEDKAWETSLAGSIEIPVKLDAKVGLNDTKITPIGFPGMGAPPTITIKKGQKDGKLTLSFVSKDKNKFNPGSFSFVMRAEGESQFSFVSEDEKKAAEEDKKKLEQVHKDLTEASKKADQARQQAQTDRDKAKSELPKNKALTEEAKKQQLDAAEKTFANAEKAAVEAKETMNRAKAGLDAANNRVKKITERAKPKKVKFAAYSRPIHVKLVPAPFRVTEVKVPERLAAGAEHEIPVKVERLFKYEGTIEVLVELPKDLKGVTVAKVDIPKGQSEARLKIVLAKDAPVGELKPDLVVRTKLNNQNLEEKRQLSLKIEAPPPPPPKPAAPPVEKKPEAKPAPDKPAEAKPDAKQG